MNTLRFHKLQLVFLFDLLFRPKYIDFINCENFDYEMIETALFYENINQIPADYEVTLSYNFKDEMLNDTNSAKLELFLELSSDKMPIIRIRKNFVWRMLYSFSMRRKMKNIVSENLKKAGRKNGK